MKPTAFFRSVVLSAFPQLHRPLSLRQLMQKNTNRLFTPILALCMTAASSHAATIVYQFNGANTATVTNGASVTAAVTSNDFGSGISASAWNLQALGASEVMIDDSGTTVGNGRARVSKRTDNGIHSFTVTIPTGVSVDFTSLSFTHGAVGADHTTLNPTKFSFTASNGGAGTPATGSFGGTAPTSVNYSIALTGLTGETNTTVTFTITDTSGGNNALEDTHYTWIDNVTLTGTVIPEPRAALLGGLGLLMLLRRRR